MPFIETTDADGRRIRVSVTDGMLTRTVDGVQVERRKATEDEASNFGPSLPPSDAPAPPNLVALADDLVRQRARLDAVLETVDLLILDSLGGL